MRADDRVGRRRWALLHVPSVCIPLVTGTSSSSSVVSHILPFSVLLPRGQADSPRLKTFEVLGILPSEFSRQLPFQPLFVAREDTPSLNYQCWLDFAMDKFTLDVDSESPAILSKVTMDGFPVVSRTHLKDVRLAPGQKKVFSVGVKNMTKRIYTLIVERRIGKSTELLDLKPATGTLTVPYNPGELQSLFEVNQTMSADYFDVEYVKADDGQKIYCVAKSAETVGGSAPSGGDLAMHPHRYIPSLEQLNNETATKRFDSARGPVIQCSFPIDTWRRITLVLHIVSADASSEREIHLVITRPGCPPGTLYSQGTCVDWCPSFYYEQRFNWRCGSCNRHCEFCNHWASCIRCRRDTAMQHYKLADDGTCVEARVHAYKIYYDLARYLAYGCGALFAIYVLAATMWVCRQVCCPPEEDDPALETDMRTSSRQGKRSQKTSLLTPRPLHQRQLYPAE